MSWYVIFPNWRLFICNIIVSAPVLTVVKRCQLTPEGCCTMAMPRCSWHPVLSDEVGKEISLLIFTDDAMTVSLGGHQIIRSSGAFPPGKLAALYAWSLTEVLDQTLTVESTPRSILVTLPDPSPVDFFRCSEVCAGIGGTSLGAQHAGILPMVALDQTELACEFLTLNKHSCVLQGNLHDFHDMGRFHKAHSDRGGLLAGFPCQPFGTLGRHLAFRDARARTFFSVMDLAFLTQCTFLLLECVVGASQHPLIRDTLQDFCKVRHFKMIEQVLHLHHSLPNYRTRWWCLLVPDWLPDVCIPDLPCSHEFATIGDLFPFWPVWKYQEEHQLQLTLDERVAFLSPSFGTQCRLLQLTGRCPTMLHSMGNQIFPCPCGCREALSENLLRTQGLHGSLVDSQYSEVGWRHLHPREATCLIGLPVDMELGKDMRAALCMIGQIASPIQSHWMLLHMKAMLGFLTPDEILQRHSELIENHVASHVRKFPRMDLYDPRTILVDSGDAPFEVNLSVPSSVSQLLLAEARLQGTDETWTAWNAQGMLHPDSLIDDFHLVLRSSVGFGLLDLGLSAHQVAHGLSVHTMHQLGLAMTHCAGLPSHLFWSPYTLDSLLNQWPCLAHAAIRYALLDASGCFGFLLENSHWTCFKLDLSVDCLVVTWCDDLHALPPAALDALVRLCADALDRAHVIWKEGSCIAQCYKVDCGTVAFLHLGILLGLWPSCPVGISAFLHPCLLDLQCRVGFGLADDDTAVLTWLENFLPSKGVPVDAALARAQLALKRLGLVTLQRAIQSTDPWRALKTAGNNLGKPFQWVTYEELQAHVATRAAQKSTGGSEPRKPKGKSSKKPAPALALSPETLTLFPATFLDDHEDAVPVISFPEVMAQARGIAIVTLDQALGLCKADAHLSSDALAVVTIGELPNDVADNLIHLQWPALYVPTSEPVLVKGSLLNLGDVPVSQVKADKAPQVAMIETAVIRVMAYQDIFDKDWDSLLKGPVKLLQAILPKLRRCPDPKCTGPCLLFHPACDEEVAQVILDAWSWRWTTLDNRQVPANQATVFSVFLRIPLSALDEVLGLSGWHGVFVEPRPDSKTGPHPSFVTIWLPRNTTLTAALDLKRRYDVIAGLARMQQKLGLRAYKKHEKEVLEIAHPGQPFVGCSVDVVYEVGPLLHGLTHSQISALLHAWSWKARPLRPVRSSNAGQFWDIGTDSNPPAAILQTEHGAVTVALKKDKLAQVQPAISVQASTRTKKHMMAGASASKPCSSGQDPWLQDKADPWKNWKSTDASRDGQEVIFTDGRGSASVTTQKNISALEDRLTKKFEDMAKQVATGPPPGLEEMEIDSTTVAQQTVAITELRQQNQQFQQWFKDIGTRFCGLDGKLQSQQARMDELQQTLTTQADVTQRMQNDVSQLQTNLQRDMQASLDAQTARLEALLEKRSRTAWLSRQGRYLSADASWSHFALQIFWCIWLLCLCPVYGFECAGLLAESASLGSVSFSDMEFHLSDAVGSHSWTSSCRLGEALNPGPTVDLDLSNAVNDGYRFVIGTANTAGMANKLPLVASLEPGLWGLTETHLTLDGARAIRSSLKSLGQEQGRHLRFVSGAPAPARALNSQAGTWTGVAVMADFPSHELQADWSSDLFATSRIQAVTSYVGSTPIVTAVVYGAAQSPTYRDPLAITEELLNHATEHVVDNGLGPRCMVGDFNCDLMQFPVMHHWYSLGWRELQIHSTALHGTVCAATCKHATVRDFVWCSPELLQFWCATRVCPDVFPDHSTVSGTFWIPAQRPSSWYWPQPRPIPWQHVRVDDWQACMEDVWVPFSWTDDTSSSFACWSDQVEKSVRPFVTTPHGTLPPGTTGRGQTRKAMKGNPILHKVKPNRPGELPMPLSFPNLLIHRWYKQLRRLQSLLHSCRRGSCEITAATYQAQCWSSIIRAPGFRPCFRDWWPHRAVQLQASPPSLLGLPTVSELESIFLDFQLNYQRMDTWYRQKRGQLSQLRRETQTKELFRALRPDGPEPLDFLTSTTTFKIAAVHPPTGAVQLDAPLASFDGLWTFGSERISLAPCNDPSLDSSRAWCLFESDILPVPGHTLRVSRPITDIPDIHAALLDFWVPRWQSLASVPEDAWDRIVQFTQAFVPRGQLTKPCFELSDFRAAFRQKSALKTGGPDGWHKTDVTALPDCFLKDMVSLFRRIEHGAPWPDQLLRGHVFCLQKKKHIFETANFRPVVLFSLWYRLWSSMQARHYLAQLEQLASFPAFGFLSGRGCQDLTYAVQTAIEVAVGSRRALCGGMFDIEKCFNFIPRPPVFFLARWFGLSDEVLNGWTAFLTGMTRSFLVHGQPSDAVRSDTGLPEGDSLSCVGMVLLDFSFHFYQRFFQPTLNELTYVDNLELVAESPDELLAGITSLETWASMFRLRIDSQKSQLWALQPADRRSLATMGFSVVECALDLGASMSFSAKRLNRPLQSRIIDTFPLWARLGRLSLSPWHKLLVIKTALLPRALHASSNTCLGESWFTKLRSLTMKALRTNRAGANPVLRIAFVCGLDVDPGFFDAWQCLRDFWKYYQGNATIRSYWSEFVGLQTVDGSRRTYGPFAKIFGLFQKLGWVVVDAHTIAVREDWQLALPWMLACFGCCWNTFGNNMPSLLCLTGRTCLGSTVSMWWPLFSRWNNWTKRNPSYCTAFEMVPSTLDITRRSLILRSQRFVLVD